jgi:hypothetical protein
MRWIHSLHHDRVNGVLSTHVSIAERRKFAAMETALANDATEMTLYACIMTQ